MSGTEPRYFASYQFCELTGELEITYWYRVQRGRRAGRIDPWPPRRSHFGVLYKRDIPAGLEGGERDKWVKAWFEEHHVMRLCALDEIEDHPGECAADFAALQAHCCYCGKGLIDERSVAYGIGPECRAGMPPAKLTAISALVARNRANAGSG